jgi:DNA-directed RNA polymerase
VPFPVALGCRERYREKYRVHPPPEVKQKKKEQSTMTYEELYHRQCALELDGWEAGKEKYLKHRHSILSNENKNSATLPPEMLLMAKITARLTIAIGKAVAGGSGTAIYRKACRTMLKMGIEGYGRERLAYLTLRRAFNVGMHQSLQGTCIALGKNVKKDYEYMQLQHEAPQYLTKVEESIRSTHVRHRQSTIDRARRRVKLKDGSIGMPDVDWSEDLCQAIGRCLVDAMIKSGIDMFAVKPRPSVQQKSGFRGEVNYLQPTEKCEKFLATENAKQEVLHPLLTPMLVKPKAWEHTTSGGFLTAYRGMEAKLIKTRYKETLKVADEAGLDTTLRAVNAMQDTPFKVNKDILEVLEVTIKHGQGGLPMPEREELVKPFNTDEEFNQMKAAGDPVLKAWLNGTAAAHDKYHREASKRITVRHQLNLGKEFLEYTHLYWVCTLDYRGRAYPLQHWISPQADDAGRALMQFSNGIALGEEGLAIHGANCYGIDKVSFQDRINWVLENKNNILASADRPLDFKWWEDADKPYQFLAFCFEWAGFMAEGEAFVSHIPVQMDGTCSGLQHFSGLLRDQVGADAVNLSPGDTPADVYQEVADVTNRLLNEIINEGGAEDEIELAKLWLKVGVTRSETKRNVMTLPYGATLQGFTDQLISHCLKEELLTADDDMGAACRFLAKINLSAIKQVLVKSVEAMKFLQDVAGFVGRNQLPLKWTNPNGFRIVQKVMKTKTKRVETTFGGIKCRWTLQSDTDKVDSRGMRSKSAPNFIHSMDAGHLMLTVNGMLDEGITDFSMIHDSFGTHVANIPAMNRILREKFVEIYSEDWIEKFIVDVRSQLTDDKMLTKFNELVAEMRPATGTLDINSVVDSPYFFN